MRGMRPVAHRLPVTADRPNLRAGMARSGQYRVGCLGEQPSKHDIQLALAVQLVAAWLHELLDHGPNGRGKRVAMMCYQPEFAGIRDLDQHGIDAIHAGAGHEAEVEVHAPSFQQPAAVGK